MSRSEIPLSIFQFLKKINIYSFQSSPIQGAIGIVVSIAHRVSIIVTFILPLKIILLAASPSVPRYFAGIITDENREIWIGSLAGGTIIFYLASLALDERMRKLIDNFSSDIIERTNIVHKRADEREKASQVCQLLLRANAAVIFAAIALVVIFWLEPVLGFIITLLIGVLVLINVLLLGTRIGYPFVRLRGIITDNPKRYVQFNSFVVFLVGFFVILMPFLSGKGGNALVALITFIVLRQALSGIETAVINYDTLFSRRNQLFFLTRSTEGVDLVDHRQSAPPFDRFTKAERDEWVLRSLATTDNEAKVLSCVWIDPASPHERDFDVTTHGDDGFRSYRLRITLPGSRHVLANQDLLAQFNEGNARLSPPIISRFSLGENTCITYDTTGLEILDPTEQSRMEEEFLLGCWSFMPPKKLVAAYRRSHVDLADRFTKRMIADLQAAADNPEEQNLVRQLDEALPAIREHLERAPFYIHFERRSADWLRIGPDGRCRTLYPGHWHIEPVGARLPKKICSDTLSAALERARHSREDIPHAWGPTDASLVNSCARLVPLIKNRKLKECLATVETLLSLLPPPSGSGLAISPDRAG